MSKRSSSTLDGFFQPQKKAKVETMTSLKPTNATSDASVASNISQLATSHETYPFPVPALSDSLQRDIDFSPASDGKSINDKPDLDLVYYAPFMQPTTAKQLFSFLRTELFFYRVKYTIKRGTVETPINTPRYTTVFGVDETSSFVNMDGVHALVEANTEKPVPKDKYACRPRPIPECLDALRRATEAITGETFNFCLVNYYASGADSISYHSDDERFLGADPCIASFSLGAKRDFLLRHKPVPAGSTTLSAEKKAAVEEAAAKPLKLPLASGDMVLMKGTTQSLWLHSIPKRKGGEADSVGRINITFRKALVKGGTDNYYRYNVGDGESFKWDATRREMAPWKAAAA